MCVNCNDSSPSNVYNLQFARSSNCGPSVADCPGGLHSTKCSFYSGPNLSCTGINTDDSLELALQKMDEAICANQGDYSLYNMHCLPTYFGQAITTESQFVNAITSYACAIRSDLDLLESTTLVTYQGQVAVRFGVIEQPNITATAAGVTTADDIWTVLDKYGATLLSLENAQAVSGVTWDACFTVVTTPTTIAEGFSLLADQICQTKALAGVTLPVFNNTGNCLPSGGASDTLVSTVGKIITRLCQTGTFDINALTWGYLTQPSVTTTNLQAAFQTVLTNLSATLALLPTVFSADFVVTATDGLDPAAGLTIALATPLNVDRFVAATTGDTSPGTLQSKLVAGTNVTLDYSVATQVTINAVTNVHTTNSFSVAFTGQGSVGSPLSATVPISATAGNVLIVNTDGLYASAIAPATYNFIETSTTKTVVTGDDVAVSVKIDTSQVDNILVYSANGLYVPSPASFATVVVGGTTATANVISTPGSGTSYVVTANVRVSSTATNQILTAETDGLAVQVSSTAGNGISILGDGIYVSSAATLAGTLNYVTKFTSSTTVGDSTIYDNGTGVVFGGTTVTGLVNILGTTYINNPSYTYSTGTDYALSVSNTPILAGTLPTSLVSFSAIPIEYRPNYNGNTTIHGDTPLGAILANTFTKFTGGAGSGAVTMSNNTGGGIAANSAIIAGTYDDGTINGTITKSAGIHVEGIGLVSGASAVITRTNHYQVLVGDSNAKGHGSHITNKWGVYQVGSSDTNLFNGGFMLPNLPTYADNTAAAALATGTLYKTATGVVMVKY